MSAREWVRMLKSLLVVSLLSWACVAKALPADQPVDQSHIATEKLIDALADIDSPTPGLHPTLSVSTFLADDSPESVEVGVFGSVAPKQYPQMVELVRRGLDSLPLLIEHLDDKRYTKLVVGGGFFMFRVFSDEYDPKIRTSSRPRFIPSLSHVGDNEGAFKAMMNNSFEGEYKVRIGDVCYALIGQIVNRRLYAVRYQPSAGLIITSPVESPILIDAIRKDWSGIDSEELMASFVNDARLSKSPFYEPALRRLKFYFPSEYQMQAHGELEEKIRQFEANASGGPRLQSQVVGDR